jgi:G3E family GTPase
MKVRMVIIGGFLGAGKTTLITRLARDLKDAGVNVGIIMNDQADTLVDTQYAQALGLSSCEVAGGCFCCRFPDLMGQAERLVESSRPQVVMAEPVGSCTDLLATVVAPLKAFYPERFQVAPLMVMVDAERAIQEGFDRQTLNGYLRRHQLEEAEVVILSKADLVGREDIERLKGTIAGINPRAITIVYSAVNSEGYGKVLDVVRSEEVSENGPKEIDYAVYAEAEAELGWYNGTLRADFGEGVDSHALGMAILGNISSQYPMEDIAHAKVMVTSLSNAMKMSCVRGRVTVDLARGSRVAKGPGRITVNARVVSDPGRLKGNVRAALEGALPGKRLEFEREDCFSPAPPKPFHRMT